MAIHRKPDHIFKEYGLTRAKKQHNPAHITPLSERRRPRGEERAPAPRTKARGHVHERAHHGPIDRTFGGGGRSEPQFDRLVRGGIAIRAVAPGSRTFAERGIVRAGERLRASPGNVKRRRRPLGVIPPSPFGRGVSSSFGSRRRRPLRRLRARR